MFKYEVTYGNTYFPREEKTVIIESLKTPVEVHGDVFKKLKRYEDIFHITRNSITVYTDTHGFTD